MRRALEGLNIIEIPDGVAVRYCGRLFAAHGATVMQAGAPRTTGVGFGGAASEGYAAWLDDGKHRIDAGFGAALGADFSTALSAVRDADLVIAGQTRAIVERVDTALSAQGSVAPLRVALTWFDMNGPYRDWIGTDALIQALSGVAYATGPRDGVPMLPRGHAPQVVGGATAFIAALAAIIGRAGGWHGHRIDLNLFEANLCFSESTAAALALSGETVVRRGVNRFTPTYPGGIYRASDGWIGLTALTPAQWTALCAMIGHPELAREPRDFVTLQRLERADEIEAVLAPALLAHSAAYWLAEGQKRRIPFAPVPSLRELPETPHWRGRDSFSRVRGTSVSCVGPTLPFSSCAPGAAAGSTTRASVMDAPLRGVRVLDLTMGWAGPLATRHFADLGADVVKVESCSYFDWWRAYDGPMDGDPPPYEVRPSFLMMNRNKRGITLDLKTAQGRALLLRLAARCDLMIENYTHGTLEKLGVGPDDIAKSAPGLISISMAAFGASGPWRDFRAYGSTIEQASGLPFVNGDADGPPAMQHVAYGDSVGGIYAAVAGMIALYAARKHSAGAKIDLCQVACLFQLGADAIVAQSTQTAALRREGSRQPLSALRACVASRVPQKWIAVSVETAAQWNALCATLGCNDLAASAGSAAPALKVHESAVEKLLERWAAARDSDAAVALLQRAGVPAAPVLAAEDLLRDPQLAAAGTWRRAERKYIGSHIVPLAPYRLDGSAPPLHRPAPTLGEHNAEILGGELGLAACELDELAAAGVIGTRAAGAGQ
ncbi:MAG: CoA transferase [Betaproteobacteria bacterium]|nr:CoA transferase [Betaproteobacteria bacterium]